jgi:trehalose 6-phosphate synthase/phosphatase
MFRALLLFQDPTSPKTASAGGAPPRVLMEPPLSVTLLAGKDAQNQFAPVELALEREAVFATAVGHSSKRTLATWHVTTPEEVVEHMLYLVGLNGEKSSL